MNYEKTLEFEKINRVNDFIKTHLDILYHRKKIAKISWILTRVLIFGIDLIALGLVCFIFYRSVSIYNNSSRTLSKDTFWGTVGPNIVLCILILLLFIVSSLIIFFKSRSTFEGYKKAMLEIQELQIHWSYSKEDTSGTELLKKVQKIYDNVMSKQKIKALHALRENFLGE